VKNMKPTSLVNSVVSDFVAETKEKYVDFFRQIEVTVHHAIVDDIAEINAFFSDIYSPEIAGEVSPYETFRAIKYGLVIILRDRLFSMIACQYLIPYKCDVKVSYAMRMAVRKDWEGKGIAINLYRLCTSEAIRYQCERQDCKCLFW
jgi:GNAT superfamily N-acetyltransferase